jgi:hypothetical protein
MAKKRRTKEQKIIARLRRQLQSSSPSLLYADQNINVLANNAFHQELPVVERPKTKNVQKDKLSDQSIYIYDPKLIKKSLVKTLLLSIFFLISIFFIQRFSHF